MGWDVPDRLPPEVLVDLLNLSAVAWLELRRHEEVFLARDLYLGNFWYDWFEMVSTLAGHRWDFSQRQILQHLAFRVVDVLHFCTPVRQDVGKRALEALFGVLEQLDDPFCGVLRTYAELLNDDVVDAVACVLKKRAERQA